MPPSLSECLHACPQDIILAILADIAGGAEYLHSKGIIHGDIKQVDAPLCAYTCTIGGRGRASSTAT